MKNLILLFSLLLLFSCQPKKTVNYNVKAGKHRSTAKVTILTDNVLSYSFTTNNSWKWKSPVKNGWSKVTGIAWNSNHENSVRITYMVVNDTVGLIGYYYYLNGVSPQQNHTLKGILDTIAIGNTYQGRLGYENGYYFISLNNKHHSLYVGAPLPAISVRSLQHPYIGGTYTINHNWLTSITTW